MTTDRIYRLIRLLIFLMGSLPRKTLNAVSDRLGLLWFIIDKRHRNVVLKNVDKAYPGKFTAPELEVFAKKIFKNLASIIFEVAWSQRLTNDQLQKYITVKGLDSLTAAHKKGRGVIVLTCHMSNFELMTTSLLNTNYRGFCLYRKLDFKPLDKWIHESRQRYGVKMISLKGASKKITKILRQEGIVATLLDQNVDWYEGVWVNFFNRPACTNGRLAALAVKTRAPVVPLFARRMGEHYILEFLPEIPVQVTRDRIKDIEINTQNFTTAIESMVRRCPEQYFWVHNRWKTKPYCLLPKKHPF
jgi:Kdo2-lipid IVA lauroyltransferase/acyltransferase